MATKKVIPIKQITSWSFSRYQTYTQCPLKAKLKFIDKIAEPGNDAMTRGSAIHTLAENYIKGEPPAKVPAELTHFAEEFKEHRKRFKKKISGMQVEGTWALRADWTETVWNDWAGCWLRVKLDLAHFEDNGTMIVTDWKTGKFRPDQTAEYMMQLELYALAAMLVHPIVKFVKPRLAYLDTGDVYPPLDAPVIYTREDIDRLKKLWANRVKPMLVDKIFAPKPNRFCGWCHFRKSNAANGGGQCKF